MHSVFNTGGTYRSIHTGGTLTPEDNPQSVYTNAIVVDGCPATSPNRTEFDSSKRIADVTPTLLENISNYVHGQANLPLDATSFNKEVFGIVYVNENATLGGDGKSWVTAYNNLQDALSNTSTCVDNEIWIAEGNYKPHASDQKISFSIPANTTIYGGFNGTETLVTERDWNTNPTILSGDLNNSNTSDDGDSDTIIFSSGDNAIFDGLIIEFDHAYAFGASQSLQNRGAGMYNTADNIQIKNCIFRNNRAEDRQNGGQGEHSRADA